MGNKPKDQRMAEALVLQAIKDLQPISIWSLWEKRFKSVVSYPTVYRYVQLFEREKRIKTRMSLNESHKAEKILEINETWKEAA